MLNRQLISPVYC